MLSVRTDFTKMPTIFALKLILSASNMSFYQAHVQIAILALNEKMAPASKAKHFLVMPYVLSGRDSCV